eukprot:167043_1
MDLFSNCCKKSSRKQYRRIPNEVKISYQTERSKRKESANKTIAFLYASSSHFIPDEVAKLLSSNGFLKRHFEDTENKEWNQAIYEEEEAAVLSEIKKIDIAKFEKIAHQELNISQIVSRTQHLISGFYSNVYESDNMRLPKDVVFEITKACCGEPIDDHDLECLHNMLKKLQCEEWCDFTNHWVRTKCNNIL